MNIVDYGEYQRGGGTVLLLGQYDSLHIGHRALIEAAKEYGLKISLLTFSDSFVLKGERLVYTLGERLKILEGLGVDTVIKADFDERFKNTPPLDFLGILKKSLDLKAVVCGYDYKFGRAALAGVDELKKFCLDNSIDLKVCGRVDIGGQKASSSLAKTLLLEGDMQKVNALLGGDYFVSGNVVGGRKVGRTLGYPTANIEISPLKAELKEGVYGVYSYIGGKKHSGICHIGKKPTFDNYTVTVEVFFKDFDGDLYGQELCVYFTKYIRGTKKFDDADALKIQIKKDLEMI